MNLTDGIDPYPKFLNRKRATLLRQLPEVRSDIIGKHGSVCVNVLCEEIGGDLVAVQDLNCRTCMLIFFLLKCQGIK